MTQALRWILGLLAVGVGAGLVALAVIGRSFRSSFGASPVALLPQFGPLLLLLLLVLASVVWPGNRLLLHLTAAAVAVAGVGLVFVLRESGFVGSAGLAFCAAWFVFYARSL